MVAKTRKKIEEFFNLYPGYLKKSAVDVCYLLSLRYPKINFTPDDVMKIKSDMKKKVYPHIHKDKYNQYSKVLDAPIQGNTPKFRRLFWDIEVSYSLVSVWRIGYKINISHDNIVKEAGIICIAYKWADEDKVHTLNWNKGDDKKLIKDFIKVLDQADESIFHNGQRFDEPWLRTRALFHNISMNYQYSSLDTLKLARQGFKFQSNRLDYLAKFMGFGGKIDTGGFKLWQDIVERNDPSAMKRMLSYCANDVLILEKVYNKLNNYTKAKIHAGVILGNSKCSCPNCGSENRIKNSGNKVTATGTIYKRFICKDCGKRYQVSLMSWNTYNKLNMKK